MIIKLIKSIKNLFTKPEPYTGPPIILGLPPIEKSLPTLKEKTSN